MFALHKINPELLIGEQQKAAVYKYLLTIFQP